MTEYQKKAFHFSKPLVYARYTLDHDDYKTRKINVIYLKIVNNTYFLLVDTKNGTYLTGHGLSIITNSPYNEIKIVINESNIIEPAKERCKKFFESSKTNESDKQIQDSEYITLIRS